MKVQLCINFPENTRPFSGRQIEAQFDVEFLNVLFITNSVFSPEWPEVRDASAAPRRPDTNDLAST
jgi:hypothetical protein